MSHISSTARRRQLLVMGATLLTVLACTFTSTVAPVADVPGWPATAAARTWSAMETSAYLSATPTFTAAPATDTPPPTETLWASAYTDTPTNTPVPMLTPLPSKTPTVTPSNTPTPTITPRIYSGGGSGGGTGGGGGGGGSGGGGTTSCYDATVVRHVTIPNGEILRPGTAFTKIWRVKNTGSCTWPITARMVAAKNSGWDGASAPLGETVRPGDEADFAIDLVAPPGPANYTGAFVIKVDNKTTFGPSDEDYFYVQITSADATGEIWNFMGTKNICMAQWKVGGSKNLNCPGKFLSDTGFIALLPKKAGNVTYPPVMEDDVNYGKVLWTKPPVSGTGEITGAFPALLIQNGDKIRVEVGCLKGYEKCNVTFQVLWQTLGGSKNPLTPEFNEVYDGAVHTLIDDSISGGSFNFTNQYIIFTFRVRGYSDKGQDAAAWIKMLIYR